jgi:hypothetical protein
MKDPGRPERRYGKGRIPGVWVLLANPRQERRFVKFLELSKVGRVMVDETNSGR